MDRDHPSLSWLIVNDRHVLAGFYRGNSTLFRQPQFGAWLKPLGGWFFFIGIFCGFYFPWRFFFAGSGRNAKNCPTIVPALIIMKIRAELGPPQNEFYNVSAEPILINVFGSRFLGRQNLALMPLSFFTNRTQGSHPGPHFWEAFKLAQTMRTPLRSQQRLAWAMLVAAGVGSERWLSERERLRR